LELTLGLANYPAVSVPAYWHNYTVTTPRGLSSPRLGPFLLEGRLWINIHSGVLRGRKMAATPRATARPKDDEPMGAAVNAPQPRTACYSRLIVEWLTL
jgi:hypothetical protein